MTSFLEYFVNPTNIVLSSGSALFLYSTFQSPASKKDDKSFPAIEEVLIQVMFWICSLPKKAFNLFIQITPDTTDDLIFCLFVHSLIMTMSTPLARLLDGYWTQTDTVTEILQRFGIRTGFKKGGYEMEGVQDVNVAMHAICGLTWLTLGTFQMTTLRKYMSAHRVFGYIAALALVAHLGTACCLLFTDPLKHSLMNKLALACDLVTPTRYAWDGMDAVIRKPVTHYSIQRHIDCMVLCFIHSIEGAGTIRTVHFLQMIFGNFGPSSLIEKFSFPSTTEHGQWEYMIRMLLIRGLSNVYIAIYIFKNPNQALRASFIEEIKQFVMFCVFIGFASIFDLQKTVTIAFALCFCRQFLYILCKVFTALDSALQIGRKEATVDVSISRKFIPKETVLSRSVTPVAISPASTGALTEASYSDFTVSEDERIVSSDLRNLSNLLSDAESEYAADDFDANDKFIDSWFRKTASVRLVQRDRQPRFYVTKSAPLVGAESHDQYAHLDMGWAISTAREMPNTIRKTIRSIRNFRDSIRSGSTLRAAVSGLVSDVIHPMQFAESE